jgi:hypothetical protein
MPACGKSPLTSPACKDTVSCAGSAPEPPRGLPAGSPRSIVALASVGWLRADQRTADLHVASGRAIRLTAESRSPPGSSRPSRFSGCSRWTERAPARARSFALRVRRRADRAAHDASPRCLRVDIRIRRWPAIRLRRRTRWHHPRQPDERPHRTHAEKQPKEAVPTSRILESQAEGAGRQSGFMPASRFEGMTPQQCLAHQFEFASHRTRFR